MHRKTLLASTLALLLAGSASLAMAQGDGAPPPAPEAGTGAHGMHPGPGMPGPMGMKGGRGPRGDGPMHGPDMGVLADLHGLERLYHQAGRSRDLIALYNEVLSKSKDPRVRSYAYQHLAWAQAQPTNFDASIATMRKSLDEDLANEAKHHEAMEKMRARWEQKHTEASAPAAK